MSINQVHSVRTEQHHGVCAEQHNGVGTERRISMVAWVSTEFGGVVVVACKVAVGRDGING